MAPRESNVLLNWLGATTSSAVTHPQQSPTSGQQLFHSSMLPLWLATVLAREEICVAVLCGAPCSGKTEATRRMVAIFGDLLAIVSNDVVCDSQQGTAKKGQSLKAHRPEEFESVVRCLAERPRVLMYDDCNTQFQDYAGKLTVALTAGVKIQNLAWFVFDSGMAEAEEVDHLMNFQQKRLKDFWQSSEDGTVCHASDGKITSPEAVRRAVRQIRSQYFSNMELKVYNADWIIKEILEYAQSQHTTVNVSPLFPNSYSSSSALASASQSTPNSLTNFANALLRVLPGSAIPTLAPGMANLNHHSGPMPPMPTTMAPLPTSMASLPPTLAALSTTVGKHGAVPTNMLATANGALGGTAMHSNAMPIIGLPADQNNALAGDQQFWDQQHAPMYFVLTDGHNGSQMMPLQLQLNSPSSAASPPFTVTNPVTSTGEQTTAVDFNFDESSFAYALCLSHRPGQSPGKRDDFSLFPVDESPPQPSSPLSPSPVFQNGDLLSGFLPSKKLGKPEKRGRKELKNGHCNGVANPFVNGAMNGYSNGNGHSNGNGNGGSGGSSNGSGNSNGHNNGNGNGSGNGSNSNGGNGSKGGKHGKAQKNGYADSLKGKSGNGKKKLQNGWSNGQPTPLSNGGLTLRSVLNDYWQTHKTEIDANSDFDIKVPAGLLAKSNKFEFDEDMVLNGLKALIEDPEESQPVS
eukprot:EG_transcript_4112